MALSVRSANSSETSPLLRPSEEGPNHGASPSKPVLDRNEEMADGGAPKVPPEELTTGQLIKIMASTYLGIVLAALDAQW